MVGPEKDGTLSKCKSYAKEHNLQVRFTGKLRKKQWAKLSADSDIFLNTTNIDNTPISVIESMALGLALVSTDVGGMHFLIEDKKDGVLVPEKDVEAMAEAIRTLIEQPEVASKMTLQAREKVTSFDWEIVKVKWNQLLE